MFAIEGPIVINVAPTGMFSRIHSPDSRPPGTPPVPATKVPVVDGLIICTLESKSDKAITPTVNVLIQLLGIRQVTKDTSSGHQRAMALPASTAMGGAMGSKYWNPFVGQIWKNAAGTIIQQSRRRSRQDLSCRKNQRPTSAAMITRSPIAAGTVLG